MQKQLKSWVIVIDLDTQCEILTVRPDEFQRKFGVVFEELRINSLMNYYGKCLRVRHVRYWNSFDEPVWDVETTAV